MHKTVYQERRTFQRYDATHIIGYLQEEVINNYKPQTDGEQELPEPRPKAYAYTGSETDGGTVMPCEHQEDYGDIANAIIRTRYSESQELAIQRHAINGDYDEAPQEFDEYNAWCQYAVKTAKEWIAARS